MMDDAERALLEQTVGTAIGRAREAGEGSASIDAVLSELGWLAMLEAEPRDALRIVFGALGAVDATATALDDAVAAALGVEPNADQAVLLPRFGTWSPPGRVDGDRIRAQGLGTARATRGGRLLVVCLDGGLSTLATVETARARVRPVGGVDPRGELCAVSVDADGASATPLDPAAWASAVAQGRRAVAHQMVGACRAMLALARTHALERVQFGRPIASFQAVRHRLAESLVAVEALEATLEAAGHEPIPETAALAKAAAGRAARTVSGHCQQVLAGIGFTTEHAFHRFLKRTMALEGLFGSADEIVVDLGRQLLATRRVPKRIEL